jgi:uncharacterized membrane protein YeaQ/YmgE (transglycosylase-associated protein family)
LLGNGKESGQLQLQCGTNFAHFARRFATSHTLVGSFAMELIGTIISWAVFGLVIGFIARLLYPGRQSMGILATMALGIVGSFVGGLIAWAFGFRPEEGPFVGAGWIMSIIGALLVVGIGLFAASKSGPRTMQRY